MSEANSKADQQIEVAIARVYLKDFSFESPKAPSIFQSPVQPQLKVEVNVTPKSLGGSFYEVTLNLLIEAEHEKENVFVVEVEQGGVFEVKHANAQAMDHILTVFAPTTLFPYARAMIDHALVQGSLPPLMLTPINFEAMRQQRLQQSSKQEAPNASLPL
jgi:preprotein translocase subunit SecB